MRNLKFNSDIFILLGLISFLITGIFQNAAAEGGTVWERFSEFDPESDVVVNHNPLSEMLVGTVFPMGKSRYRLGQKGKNQKVTGTRIASTTSSKPSRLEGNRLMIHAFTKDHKEFYAGYQKGLENLSERRALATLNHNEQLAFWLNLHNVVVINMLIEEYPISKLKRVRLGHKGKGSYWSQKVTTIEGVALSLDDIENILYHNWDSPLVIYGLFQGSIGGPSLQRVAYDGKGVWKQLEESAVEFVNSNRGVRVKGSKAEVSLIYDWGKAAFGGSDAAVLAHIQDYAHTSFHGSDLSGLTSVKYKTYDWQVADLLGGTKHTGYKSNYAAFLANFNSVQGGAGETQFGGVDVTGWMVKNYGSSEFNLRDIFPPQAFAIITEAYRNNDIPRRTPVITSTECMPGDACEEVERGQ